MPSGFVLRDAVAADVPRIVTFVHDLARYEKLEDSVKITPELLTAALFGPRANLYGLIAEVNGVAAGYALFFYNFSSFEGRRGIYLEDLYVAPGHRRLGIGKGIFHYLARKAVDEDFGRFEWAVLSWNAAALKFYKNLGAVPMTEWQVQRLTGDALQAVAAAAGK
jgi:GNAT superfamily N-acetyltransferase